MRRLASPSRGAYGRLARRRAACTVAWHRRRAALYGRFVFAILRGVLRDASHRHHVTCTDVGVAVARSVRSLGIAVARLVRTLRLTVARAYRDASRHRRGVHRDALGPTACRPRPLPSSISRGTRPTSPAAPRAPSSATSRSSRELRCAETRPIDRESATQRWVASVHEKEVRRCPTLPQGHPCSTIGAVRLSFRVRNVTGRFPPLWPPKHY